MAGEIVRARSDRPADRVRRHLMSQLSAPRRGAEGEHGPVGGPDEFMSCTRVPKDFQPCAGPQARRGRPPPKEERMSTVKEAVDVDVPVHTAYNQWTQFEQFPHFMEGVENVTQLDDRHNHWTTKIGGVRREFDTEIVDQLPDERITWRSIDGDTRQQGSVRFEPLDTTHTRVELTMEVEPTGVAEKGADMLGVIDRRVKGDLRRFKDYVEENGRETGAWRGRIRPEDPGTSL
jgi:uncharacterized membrane protein